MPLLKFPTELLYIIAGDLSATDLNSLLQTNRHLSIILAPLLHKAMIQNKNKLLLWAAGKGRRAMIKVLLENSADINFWENSAALYIAVKEGHEDTVRFLLKNGAEIYNRQGSRRSALHVTSKSGHESIARLLIEKGADVDALGASGKTPLYLAIFHNRVNIIYLLIEKGCNIDFEYDIPGLESPLQQAARQADAKIVDILLDAGASVSHLGPTGSTALHAAAERGIEAKAAARLLLESGSDIDAADDEGDTPLHLAVEKGCSSMVKWLLSKGASITAVGRHQRTALHTAVIFPLRNYNMSIVKVLMENGIGIDAQDYNGNTALHLAASKGSHKMISKLLKHGANIEARNKRGSTPLLHTTRCLALRDRWLLTTQILLDNHAKINALDKHGMTALHLTISQGRGSDLNLIKLLLERGADPNIQDKLNGRTALHYAAQYGIGCVIRESLFAGSGANFSIQDDGGETAYNLDK